LVASAQGFRLAYPLTLIFFAAFALGLALAPTADSSIRQFCLRRDALEYLFAVHWHILWRIDANPDLLALNAEHCNGNVVANHESFADAASKYKHR
jgi:hypothetical protein